MDSTKNKIVAIKGGLGNQLFQYAFAKYLNQTFNISIKLDISWFKKQSLRKFELDKFVINNSFENIDYPLSLINKITSYRSEKYFTKLFKKTILPPINYFNGYWQDNFFAKYLNLDDDFKKEKLNKIINEDYYIIHLRRGDFTKSEVHYVLPDSYYKSSLNLYQDKKIYVLSTNKQDAINFIKNTNINASYIETDQEMAFNMIYNSSGGIASNSTFCWWAINISNCKNWVLPFRWLDKINIIDHNLSIKETIIK